MTTSTRRHFLKTTAAAVGAVAAPYIVPARVLGANAPSNRINVGFIGNGNQSTIDLPAFLGQPDVQVLAVCDVNTASYGYKTPDQFLGRSRRRTKSMPSMRIRSPQGNIEDATPTTTFAKCWAAKTSMPSPSWCPIIGTG